MLTRGPGVCCAGATLVEWLGLVRAGCLGITEEAGQICCPAPASICASGVEEELKLWCFPARLTRTDYQQLPLPCSRVLGLVLLYLNYAFEPWLFFYVSGQMNLLTAPQYCSSPLQFTRLGVEFLFITISISLAVHSLCGLLLCRICSGSL